MTTSSPATTRLDLSVDLHTFTDDLVWGYLDNARDPDQVVQGAELWLGTVDTPSEHAWSNSLTTPPGPSSPLRLLD